MVYLLGHSLLGPLLLLIYMSDGQSATKYIDMHHFADDVHFPYSSKSFKDINKKGKF